MFPKKFKFLYRSLGLFILTALLLPLVSASQALAQEEAETPVLILPATRAVFLPGAAFDIRVELHADAFPEDFAVTFDGENLADVFGVEATEESWEFGDEEDGPLTPAQSLVWRDVTIFEPGVYTVEVTADGTIHTATWTVVAPENHGAKNVVLFIADGMSVPMITAARLMSRGITGGKYNSAFAMDTMEEVGLVHTSGLDSLITDSANSAHAYNTGHKSVVNALGVYADTSPDTFDDPRVETFAELVKRTRDMSVGIVTTAYWTDATPGAVFAHTRRRGDRNEIARMPLGIYPEGYSGPVLLPEVILGGGARYMLPQTTEGSRRKDDIDVFTEYEENGYTAVTTAAEMRQAVDGGAEKLIGIFADNNISTWLDRNVYTDNLAEGSDEPSLVDMTMTALEVLNQNPNGFYLEIEAANVDKQMHPLDYERSLSDLIEYDNAVAATLAWVEQNAPDTLVVVTSDHGHGFDVYGAVDVEAFNAAETDEEKRNAIGTYANAGFPSYVDEDGDGFPDSYDVDRVMASFVNNHPSYTEDFQVSPVPRTPAIADDEGNYVDNPDDDPDGITMPGNLPMSGSTGVHTLQDVPVFAQGPGSEFFGRVIDNTEIFFGMAFAIGLDPLAEDGLAPLMNENGKESSMQPEDKEGMGGTVVDVATEVGELTALVEGLGLTELTATLSGKGPYTVFAPVDDAFTALGDETLSALGEDTDVLKTVLLNHVVEGLVTASDLAELDSVTTLAGEELTVTVDGDTITIGEATVTAADLESSNGTIHVIDTVLVPAE